MYRFTAVALLALSAGHALNAQEQKSEARIIVAAPEAGAKGESKAELRTFRIGAGADSKNDSRVVIIGPDGKTVEEFVAGSDAASDEPGERRVVIRRGQGAGGHGEGDHKAEKKGEVRVVIAGPDGIKAEWTTGGSGRVQAIEKDGKRSVKVVIEENGRTHVFDSDDIASLEFLPDSVRKWMHADGDGPRMLRFFRDGADAPAGAAGAFRFRSGEGDGDGFQWQKHAEQLQKQLEGLNFNFDFDIDTDSIMESVHKALAEALKNSGLSAEDREKVAKALEGLRRGGDRGRGPGQGAGQGPAQGPMRGFMQPGRPGENAMPDAVRERMEAMRERLAQREQQLAEQQQRAEIERRQAENKVRERENVVRERFRAREREQAHAPTPPAPGAGDTEARIQRLEERLERIERMLERLLPRG